MRQLQPKDILLLSRAAQLLQVWAGPCSVLLTPHLGLILLHPIFRWMKIFTVRPVIEMTVWSGGRDQTNRLCHCNSLMAWDALILHSGLHTFETQSSTVQLHLFDVCGHGPRRQSGTAPSLCTLMAFSWGLSNISAQIAPNKMAVTKPSGTFELFFPL